MKYIVKHETINDGYIASQRARHYKGLYVIVKPSSPASMSCQHTCRLTDRHTHTHTLMQLMDEQPPKARFLFFNTQLCTRVELHVSKGLRERERETEACQTAAEVDLVAPKPQH